MIDLLEKFDSHKKHILEYVISRAGLYFDSTCFNNLEKRWKSNTDSYNLNIAARGGSNARLAFPIQLEGALLRRAALKQAVRGEPLISLEPLEGTPYDNALAAQDVLGQNFNRTLFRRRTLDAVCNTVAKHGSAIVVCQPTIKNSRKTRTVIAPGGLYPQRKLQEDEQLVIENNQIHFLNYFQDASINSTLDTPYQGHIQRWTQANLMGHILKFEGSYIQESVVAIFESVKNGTSQNANYHETNKYDEGEGIDVLCFCGALPIDGNEDDETQYYLEVADDKIIRFQEGIRNYAHYYLDKREDYWWANSDVEYTKSHENLFNLLMNMQADNVLQEMMRYVFYKEGSINIAAINDRYKNGGFIPFEGNLPANQVLQTWSPEPRNTQSTEFLTREVKESMARMRTNVDLQRNPSQGGPTNKTAYGASIMATQSDIREGDLLAEFEDGLLTTAEINVTLLQELMPDVFQIRPKPNRPNRTMFKEQILGSFQPVFKSSMQKTKEGEVIRVSNGINLLLNMMGTGNPIFQKLNLEKPVRNLIRQLDLGDPDEVYPEAMSGDAIAGAPTMVPPGQPLPPELMGGMPQGQPGKMPVMAGGPQGV